MASNAKIEEFIKELELDEYWESLFKSQALALGANSNDVSYEADITPLIEEFKKEVKDSVPDDMIDWLLIFYSSDAYKKMHKSINNAVATAKSKIIWTLKDKNTDKVIYKGSYEDMMS